MVFVEGKGEPIAARGIDELGALGGAKGIIKGIVRGVGKRHGRPQVTLSAL
jgi:hypothetical protein